jgi:hypothetical protein
MAGFYCVGIPNPCHAQDDQLFMVFVPRQALKEQQWWVYRRNEATGISMLALLIPPLLKYQRHSDFQSTLQCLTLSAGLNEAFQSPEQGLLGTQMNHHLE